MNTESNICIGCLSGDRKLQILNEECKQAFCGFLDLFNYSPPICLCFECRALLQRSINFKKQVKSAYTYLFSYLQDIPKTLSKLNITNNEIVYKLNEIDRSNQNDDIKYEDNFDKKTGCYQKSEFFENINNFNLIDNGEKFVIDGELNINAKPLAFVKVEDTDEVDDQDIISDCKESFTDSDYEPLKEKSKCKERRKQTKNEKNESSRKRKKEQPSGVVTDPRVAKKLKDLNIGEGHIALVMLSWNEVREERSLALQSPQYTRHQHRCQTCIVGYNHTHKLQQHNLKHKPEAGDEVCDVCTIRCKTRAALASHRRRHRARWVCLYCDARFSQACVAADHCTRVHRTIPARHRCNHCNHYATSLGALRSHIKSHSTRPECTLCGKTFRDKSSLRTHAFAMSALRTKPHTTITNTKYNLKHIDPADIKHACQLCDKKFVKAKRLEEHNLAVHLKLTPIKCTVPECTFACPSRASLRSHTRLVHRGAASIRNYICHLCGHTYKSKKSLDSHLRSHNTTLPTQTTYVAAS